jgi:hypothetical protein
MAWLPTLRLATFGRILRPVSRVLLLKFFAVATVAFFGLIVLAVSADLISSTAPFYFEFAGLALATSLLTLITVIPMCVLILVRLPHDDVTLIPSCAGI